MARMIPPSIEGNHASRGEGEVFRRLRDDPATTNWIVLHSLDTTAHVKQIAGEADFVVIVPQKGVVCLEVKGCLKIARKGGSWYYGHDPQPDPRGPFKQAADVAHSCRKSVQKVDPGLGRIIFWSGVVFPFVHFSTQSDEWHGWQVIDARSFHTGSMGEQVERILDNARRFLGNCPSASWFDPGSALPNPRQCERIAEILRPSFEFYESPKSRARRLQEEVKRYTDEQCEALDAMEANPRVVFSGPAGTGKTLLAIETSRRSRLAGRRVLLVCFNRFLGKWIEDQGRDLRPGVVAATLHKLMLSVCGVSPPANPSQHFWEGELPQSAMEHMIERQDAEFLFDEIVMDEAQDLLRPQYLDFLDLCVKGGLSAGRWRFFGDFEKQAIFGETGPDLDGFLARQAGRAPVYSLRCNCRNTPRIAAVAHLLGALDPDYARVRRPDDGIEPEVKYYSDKASQGRLLMESLESLYAEGFSGCDIVVLSFRAGAACAASQVGISPWRERLVPFGTGEGGHIGFCTVHAFKGLEAPAIVATDIDHVASSAAQSLFYIAATRALQRLTLLVAGDARKEVVEALLNPGRGQEPKAENQ